MEQFCVQHYERQEQAVGWFIWITQLVPVIILWAVDALRGLSAGPWLVWVIAIGFSLFLLAICYMIALWAGLADRKRGKAKKDQFDQKIEEYRKKLTEVRAKISETEAKIRDLQAKITETEKLKPPYDRRFDEIMKSAAGLEALELDKQDKVNEDIRREQYEQTVKEKQELSYWWTRTWARFLRTGQIDISFYEN